MYITISLSYSQERICLGVAASRKYMEAHSCDPEVIVLYLSLFSRIMLFFCIFILLLSRIDRAAIDVKWSHDGLRFAATSGAKCIAMCTYESQNDWWVSKMIKKKFKSTVLCCAFHPKNGQLLAAGSSDFKCRVYSTYASEVDTAINAGPFGAPIEFGEAYCELSSNGWINAVAWTPSGSNLVYAGHDSSIHFATFSATQPPVVFTLRSAELPYCSLLSISDCAVVAVGHDYNPSIYIRSGSGAGWESLGKLEVKAASVAGGDAGAAGGVAAARALFQNKSSRGQESGDAKDSLWTQHENTVTAICSMSPTGAPNVAKVKIYACATSYFHMLWMLF